jgi:succinyl-CoA synthetase beta subunit
MKIHEYQGKELFRNFGVPVLSGHAVRTAKEASDAFQLLGGDLAVVKAQIHAGGRGKGVFLENPSRRGVELVRSAEEAYRVASDAIGNRLVTAQTGPAGQRVKLLYVEQGCQIERELYLAVVLDRAKSLPVLMVSSQGGVEIEHVAASTPELIFKEHFDPASGLESFQVRKICRKLGLSGPQSKSADKFMKSICRFFTDHDCSLTEINPLVVTKSGDLIALDAKITFDDNAMYRHPELKLLRDLDEENSNEVNAADHGLSYVQLDGDIGCLVNGAGLAMATMDIIKYYGGRPSNFLDVGGGATGSQVTEAFRILLTDPNCKGILVNIFGGIARCTTIAGSIIQASKELGFNIPLVVRLEGTEVEEGRKMLEESDVKIISAKNLSEAAEKIVTVTASGK